MSKRESVSVLSDRYELSDLLGAGGMAEVLLGRDRVLGRTVAVKTLLPQYAGDPTFIERFRREAQSVASLNHPNVVSVYDTGTDNGTYYIVMEYVEGKTLRDVIREEGPLLAERVAEIGAEVCAALAFAHSHGIIHRDVKPANIMITPQGSVKVTDFGIARAASADSVTQTAMVLGTAQYFSPEQAQSSPVDARSDVYSLGVVLYEMLTKQVPFTGSSPVAIAYKHVKEDPVLPSRLNADVPAALESIVMKAMAKNPNNRYQSAQEMREDLQRALHGRPVEATPVLSDATGVISPLSDDTIVLERRAGAPVVRREPTAAEKRRRTGMVLLTVIALAILGIAAWALTGLLGGDVMLRVPDVLGRPIDRAEDILRERGFEVDILPPIASDEFDPGEVAYQNPESGSQLERGGTVQLASSRGPDLVAVPDLEGKTLSQARAELKRVGLEIGDVRNQPSDTVARGRIISQSPPARSNLRAGSKVDVVVSQGRETVAVPDVIGRREDDARFALEARDLNVQVRQEPQSPTCDEPVGHVCRQHPRAGTTVERGSNVTIWVAEEPPPLPTETPEPFPTETPTSGETGNDGPEESPSPRKEEGKPDD